LKANGGPRIGIIGTGAIGGFYGILLARAGFDVHFLMRSDFDAVREHGMQLHSAQFGSMSMQSLQVYDDPAQMPACDWLLVGAKTTSNSALAPTIAQLAAPGAKVVLLQNGLGVEDSMRLCLPQSLHLLGGLCYICVQRSGPGIIEHQSLGDVTLGYHSGPAPDMQAEQVLLDEGAALFAAAGVRAAVTRDLQQARWQKLVWNVPYNGLSVVLDAGTTALMGSEHSRGLIRSLMQEVLQAAAACSVQMPQGYADKLLALTDKMPDYLPSMYHDFRVGRPLELQAIYEAPLTAAHAAGCELPRVQMLLQTLRFIEQHGRGH
jgi:2-dehydropantoate 2-reductase